MKPILVVAALLCAVLPGSAQTAKVYTNADLSAKPVTTWSRTVTPAEWSGIVSRQFIAPPDGPTVIVLGASERLGPMPPSYYASPSSYADDLWRDPVTAYAVQHPIEAAYGFRHAYGSSVSQTSQTARGAGRTPTATPPAPPIVTTAASAGRRVR